MKPFTLVEKNAMIENVESLIRLLDKRIQKIYSEAYYCKMQESEVYNALPWYKRLYSVNPEKFFDLNIIHVNVAPFEACICNLIMVRSRFPATAIVAINMSKDHYEQYEAAVKECYKLLNS